MSIQFSGQSAYGMAYNTRPQLTKAQHTEAAADLFSALDSQNKGYLEQSDFSSLLTGLQNQAATEKSADLFGALDSDANGQLTSAEFSSNFSDLLYSAQGTMGAIGSKLAPPQDSGKSKDELTALLEKLSQKDNSSTEGLQSVIENFDTADADGDGKVTMQEARGFSESQQSGASSLMNKTNTSQHNSEGMAKLLGRTMQQLMNTYGGQSYTTSPSGTAVNIIA
jgi:Ca2+-binding EF-hand superfamily protein